MAGNWIKFELATLEKPEVWDIASSLNLDPDAVVGKLLHVWCWFDQQSEKGNAPSVSKSLLDRKVGVTGFCDSVISCGWMIEEQDPSNEDKTIITLPNFDRHNGKTAKNRALTAKRVSNHKVKVTQDIEKGNAPIVSSALPKEEKRREEKILSNTPPSVVTPKDEKKKAARNTQLPVDFVFTPDMRDKAVKYWMAKGRHDLNANDAFGQFVSYHRSKGSTMKCWQSAWETWYVNQVRFIDPPKVVSEQSTRNRNIQDDLNDRSWANQGASQ